MEGHLQSKADGLAIWPLGKQPPSSTLSTLSLETLHPLCPLSPSWPPPARRFSILARGGFTPTSGEIARTKVKRQIAINGERVQLQRAIFHPLDPRRHVPPRATLATIAGTTCLVIGRTTSMFFRFTSGFVQGLPIGSFISSFFQSFFRSIQV